MRVFGLDCFSKQKVYLLFFPLDQVQLFFEVCKVRFGIGHELFQFCYLIHLNIIKREGTNYSLQIIYYKILMTFEFSGPIS